MFPQLPALAASMHVHAGMAMSEFEAASETRDMAARERAVTTHCSVLGVTILVFALIVAALLLGR